MEEMFARTALLLGEEGLEKLKRARVAVFAWAASAARRRRPSRGRGSARSTS